MWTVLRAPSPGSEINRSHGFEVFAAVVHTGSSQPERLQHAHEHAQSENSFGETIRY
jgi:hypothetical protein